MKLNNIYRILILAFALVAMNACEVTDIDPADRIPEDQTFTDGARVLSTVIGVYEAAQRGYYGTVVDRGYPFGAASTAQGDMKGEDMYNDQLFYEVTYTNAWNTTTANNNGMWIGLYRLTNRINIVLAGIEEARSKGVITDVQAAGYRGELLFLRALSYHELLIHFARPYSDDPAAQGIPYRTTPINEVGDVSEGLALDRGTVGGTYTQVLADLDEAETLLTTGTAPAAPYRATRGAVVALKTRVKLHMEDWAGVLAEYAKISASYTLTASPETPFSNWTSTEAVFSLQNSAASNPGTNAALVNMYGSPGLGGRGLVKISPLIWRSSFWVAGDLRRTLLATSHSSGFYSFKYRRFGTNDDSVPLIRFAEVVLNAAEANARLNQFPEAITLLNSIRNRAVPVGTPPHDLVSLGGTQAGVLQGIWNERRIEFLAEGRRWSDIHRLAGEGALPGIPAKAQSRSVTLLSQYSTATVNQDHALPYSSHLFLWPIPLDEVLNNPTLAAQQNPGYN